MIKETSCDAVMIGRGVLGNPWLIKETIDYLEYNIEPKQITKQEKINMIKKHLNYLLEIKDEKIAILEMRSHTAWYLKGIKGATKVRKQINAIKTKEDLIKILDEFEEENYEF